MSTNNAKSRLTRNLTISVAGLILFFLGAFVMSGEQFKPALLEGIDLHLGEAVANLGIFLLLWIAVDALFVSHLRASIEERTSNLEATFSEAEKLRSDMDELKASYEARIEETEVRAREQIREEVQKAQDLAKRLRAEAESQADEYKRTAMAEIDAERERVIGQLRVEVAKLALQASERIISENMDNERNRKLVDEFLSEPEVNLN